MTAPSRVSPGSAELADLRRTVIELRDWKAAVLDKCKASDGWGAMAWGGDKEGWGFVHYFIGHLETRALHAETVLAEQDARGVAQNSKEPAACLGNNAPCDHFVGTGNQCVECEVASSRFDKYLADKAAVPPSPVAGEWQPSIPIKPRRPLDDCRPDGYSESDRDFINNNQEAVLEFLERCSMSSTHCACDTDHPLFKERGHHPLCPMSPAHREAP